MPRKTLQLTGYQIGKMLDNPKAAGKVSGVLE